jgi:hypothetical protein
MLTPHVFLAQVPVLPKEPLNPSKSQKLFGADITLVLGILLVITAVAFFWAIFIRKRPKQIRGALVLERAPRHSKNKESEGSSGRRKRRKRRPDHPDNWGRNPTLSETGGLPPARPEDPDNPPAEPQNSQSR